MPGKCLRDVALGQLPGCEMGLTLESEEGALGHLAGCEMGLTLESEEGEVPHLRWSQAPPLPWPRPGSADLYVFIYRFVGFWLHLHRAWIYQAGSHRIAV